MDQPGRHPKLLKDYAPPDYLVDEVDLDIALDPRATQVRSKLRLRANPKISGGLQKEPVIPAFVVRVFNHGECKVR